MLGFDIKVKLLVIETLLRRKSAALFPFELLKLNVRFQNLLLLVVLLFRLKQSIMSYNTGTATVRYMYIDLCYSSDSRIVIYSALMFLAPSVKNLYRIDTDTDS